MSGQLRVPSAPTALSEQTDEINLMETRCSILKGTECLQCKKMLPINCHSLHPHRPPITTCLSACAARLLLSPPRGPLPRHFPQSRVTTHKHSFPVSALCRLVDFFVRLRSHNIPNSLDSVSERLHSMCGCLCLWITVSRHECSCGLVCLVWMGA